MASRTNTRQSAEMSQTLSRRETQATKKEKVTFGGRVKKLWQKAGLDQQTIILMMKYAMKFWLAKERSLIRISGVDWPPRLL